MKNSTRTLGLYVVATVICLTLVLRPTAGLSVSPLVLKWLAVAALIMIALRGAAELYLRRNPDDKRPHGGIVKPHDADQSWPQKSKQG